MLRREMSLLPRWRDLCSCVYPRRSHAELLYISWLRGAFEVCAHLEAHRLHVSAWDAVQEMIRAGILMVCSQLRHEYIVSCHLLLLVGLCRVSCFLSLQVAGLWNDTGQCPCFLLVQCIVKDAGIAHGSLCI